MTVNMHRCRKADERGLWKARGLFAMTLIIPAAIAGPYASAAPLAPLDYESASQSGPLIVPVIDRPEIRSYQPYSGLQFNFAPTPPVQRGVHRKRPKIVEPRPVEPVIEYGASRAHSTGGYAYCLDRPGQIEPRDGPYGDQPLGQRTCP
jgi:hypothetical protein